MAVLHISINALVFFHSRRFLALQISNLVIFEAWSALLKLATGHGSYKQNTTITVIIAGNLLCVTYEWKHNGHKMPHGIQYESTNNVNSNLNSFPKSSVGNLCKHFGSRSSWTKHV